jgi:hypothetical protein
MMNSFNILRENYILWRKKIIYSIKWSGQLFKVKKREKEKNYWMNQNFMKI